MIKVAIKDCDLAKIKTDRYEHPTPIVQKRLHTLYLKACTNFNHEQIALIVDIHRDTVTTYLKMYNEGGLPLIYSVNYGTNKSELDNHRSTILAHFEQHPPHSINEAIAMIKQLTGIQRGPTQVRKWLKKTDFAFVKRHKYLPKPIK